MSKPKTVTVRIAVAVDPTGGWNACGYSGMRDTDGMEFASETLHDGEARYWLIAELPVPEAPMITARVERE
jgi:hypothetical protein